MGLTVNPLTGKLEIGKKNNYSIYRLINNECVRIPTSQQMAIVGMLEIETGAELVVPTGAKVAILRES